MQLNQYNKLLTENITKTYEKCESHVKVSIDKEAKKLAEPLNLDCKMQCFADRTAYITINDHKPNFQHNIKCRLINPAKSEMGIVSKKHLEDIVKSVQNTTC